MPRTALSEQPFATSISAVTALVETVKGSIADDLRLEGRSRIARQVLSLPSDAAEAIIAHASNDLPACSRALAVASASASARFAEIGELKKAVRAADVAMVMFGMPAAIVVRELVEEIEPHVISNRNVEKRFLQAPLGHVRKREAVTLPGSLTEKCAEVHVSDLSIEAFRAHFEGDRPLIIRGCASSWPATKTWCRDGYLDSRYGHRTVPVELSTGDGEIEEQFYLLGDVLRKMRESDGKESIYMAQHPLFDYLPQLEHDVVQPKYMLVVGKERADLTNVWMGTEGSGSKLHFDSADNLLVQIVGEKMVVLISADQSNLLYRKSAPSPVNISPVNVQNPDLQVYPNFARARGQLARLMPGDALYIPAQHWHWVKACSASISVNFWF